MNKFKFLLITLAYVFTTQASATSIDLNTQIDNGITCTTASVTGNSGGSTDCYGIFDGNDNVNDTYLIGTNEFSFLGKDEDGAIDLQVPGATSGTWSLTQDLLNSNDFGDFFLVIKSGNDWGAYLFSGTDNSSTSGNWQTTDSFLNKNGGAKGISHMSIYATGITTVPEPSILALFGLGLIGMGLTARRKRKS